MPWSVACVTMWKIGPECAAQQAKCVSAIAQNCGVASDLARWSTRGRARAAPPIAAAPTSPGCSRMQQGHRDDHQPGEVAEDEQRDAPVRPAGQRAGQRRDDQDADADARRTPAPPRARGER